MHPSPTQPLARTHIQERTSSERAKFGKAFSGGGKGLYEDEEARAAEAAKAAADARAAEEAALLAEWRNECDELRKRRPADPTAELLWEAASRGDREARAALDKLAPITLQEFGEAKLKAAEKERKRLEAEETRRREKERKARDDALRRSDVSLLAAEDDEEAELLKGLNRGYKTRADGSKTSYFDRSEQLDPETKALLDAQKAPKRIEPTTAPSAAASCDSAAPAASEPPLPGAPPPPAPPQHGSVWNTGGTWEERDVSAWAHAYLREHLGAISMELPSSPGVDVESAKPASAADTDVAGCLRVSRVDQVDGHASIILSRGKVRGARRSSTAHGHRLPSQPTSNTIFHPISNALGEAAV